MFYVLNYTIEFRYLVINFFFEINPRQPSPMKLPVKGCKLYYFNIQWVSVYVANKVLFYG